MDPVFTHDEKQRLFIVELEGRQGTIHYSEPGDGVLDFQSTYIPSDIRRKGLGTQLVRYALRWASDHHAKVIPSCWFVRAVIDQDKKSQ